MYQLGWFSTGRDKAARDLLEVVQSSIEQGEIEAEIGFVFCNREPGESAESDLFLKLVKSYHIIPVYVSYQRLKNEFKRLQSYYLKTSGSYQIPPSRGLKSMLKHPWRQEYDRRVMANVEGFHPDLCVLAGYMLIVGKEMCRRYDMINLHPAAPNGPKGMWQEVIWQLIDSKAQETGVMMHLVTSELDMGPPVSYCTFSIRGEPFDEYWQEIAGHPIKEIQKGEGENNPLFKLIREHGLAREFPLIVSTIQAFSQGKVKISPGKQVVDAEGRLINGYNLTDEINEELKGAA